MKIFDISMDIGPNMMIYKDKVEKKPKIQVTRDFSNGGTAYESTITIDLHTGTHMDAPLHMVQGGDTIDQQDLSKLVTSCKVLDLTEVEDKITQESLEKKNIEQGDFLLLKTRNSSEADFNYDFVYLEKGGAQYLKDKGVIGVGIDALGIERAQPEHDTHEILMGQKIVIIEGLVLKDIEEGTYTLIALPLKIIGAEASPVRAILIQGL